MKQRVLLSGFLFVSLAGAHPMGKSSVNHYARLQVGARGVTVRYALDLAEDPAADLMGAWNLDASAQRAELERKGEAQARDWIAKLEFRMEGRTVAPHFERSAVAVGQGEGGRPVLRVTADLTLPVAAGRLEYEDRNYAGHAGWKEVVIAADSGASIEEASHDARDRSQALTVYPQDAAAAAPQELRAVVVWVAAASQGATARIVKVPQPSSDSAARGDFLAQILRRGDLGAGVVLLGMAVAFGFGAMHALSPGHGKTIVAAYLVGSRGTIKHALLLGATVTFTHTFIVFCLALTTLFLSQYVLTEKMFPVLGAISGLSIVWIGGILLYQRVRVLRSHTHGHEHHHHHGHDDGHDHDHGPHGHSHVPEGEVTLGSLLTLGVSGGLVPCPSALVLLLSSVALGRVALGLLLLVGFSLGLATVLMGIGMLVVCAKHLLPDSKRTASHPAFRVIPVVSAVIIVCLGLLMTGVSLGIIKPNRLIG